MKSLLWIGVVVIATPGVAPAQSATALPDDPLIRQWVLDVEEVFEAVLEIRYWRDQSRLDNSFPRAKLDPDRIVELLDQVESSLSLCDSLGSHCALLAGGLIRQERPLESAMIWDRRRNVDVKKNFRRRGYPGLGEGDWSEPELLRYVTLTGTEWRDIRLDPRLYLAFVRRLRLSTGGKGECLESFLAPLPNLPRVKRVGALYYRWTRNDGCPAPFLVGDRFAEPTILLNTAKVDPDRFEAVLRLVYHAGNQRRILRAVSREGNALSVFRQCFEAVPDQRDAARQYIESIAFYRLLAPIVWQSYLDEGAPTGSAYDHWVTEKLRSRSEEDREIGLLLLAGCPADRARISPATLASAMMGRTWEQIEHEIGQHYLCQIDHADSGRK